jgi:hypothetical protein
MIFSSSFAKCILTYENHHCKIDHRCGNQCRRFCQLPHGHTDPYHNISTHRANI